MKPRRTTILAIASGLTLLLGSGLLSLVSDSVVSNDNLVGSEKYAPLDLRVAKVGIDSNCAGGAYSDGPIKASFGTGASGRVDLDGTSPTLGDNHLCFKNFGTKSGRLSVTFADVIEVEIGKCEPSESDPDGGSDTSCLDAEMGELQLILDVAMAKSADPGGTSASCTSLHAPFTDLQFGLLLAEDLGAGEVCRFQPQISIHGSATDTQRLAAQTDAVHWDFVFNLQRFEDLPS